MKFPVTPATRFLKQKGVSYQGHLYTYVEKGGTAVSAQSLQVPEAHVVKTLVFKDSNQQPFVVLMTGDKQVSEKEMARVRGVKSVKPCSPQEAQKYSGYQVGGTSPFGLRREMDIYMEKSIELLALLYINGGKRGFLVSLTPQELMKILSPELAEVGI